MSIVNGTDMGLNLCVYVGPMAIVKPKTSVDEFDVSEAINERLFHFEDEGGYLPKNKVFWLPNVDYEGNTARQEWDDQHYGGFIDVDPEFIRQEKQAFASAFTDEIKILSAEYGEAIIHWGILGGYC